MYFRITYSHLAHDSKGSVNGKTISIENILNFVIVIDYFFQFFHYISIIIFSSNIELYYIYIYIFRKEIFI